MVRKKKSDSWDDADLADCFPGANLAALGAEARFGLLMNVPRIRALRAWAVADGYGIAITSDPLDPAWGEARAECPEQEKESAYRIEADRMTRRVKQNARGR